VDAGLGIHLLLPLRDHGTQAVGDVSPLGCPVFPLADILPQVENEQMVSIDDKFPVAAAYRAHAAVADVRPPIESAFHSGSPALQHRKEIDAVKV
jgi:hypothetical protein